MTWIFRYCHNNGANTYIRIDDSNGMEKFGVDEHRMQNGGRLRNGWGGYHLNEQNIRLGRKVLSDAVFSSSLFRQLFKSVSDNFFYFFMAKQYSLSASLSSLFIFFGKIEKFRKRNMTKLSYKPISSTWIHRKIPCLEWARLPTSSRSRAFHSASDARFRPWILLPTAAPGVETIREIIEFLQANSPWSWGIRGLSFHCQWTSGSRSNSARIFHEILKVGRSKSVQFNFILTETIIHDPFNRCNPSISEKNKNKNE